MQRRQAGLFRERAWSSLEKRSPVTTSETFEVPLETDTPSPSETSPRPPSESLKSTSVPPSSSSKSILALASGIIPTAIHTHARVDVTGIRTTFITSTFQAHTSTSSEGTLGIFTTPGPSAAPASGIIPAAIHTHARVDVTGIPPTFITSTFQTHTSTSSEGTLGIFTTPGPSATNVVNAHINGHDLTPAAEAIIGVTLILICLAGVAVVWLVRRRRRIQRMTMRNDSESTAGYLNIDRQPAMLEPYRVSIAHMGDIPQRSSIEKGGQGRAAAEPASPSSPTISSPTSASNMADATRLTEQSSDTQFLSNAAAPWVGNGSRRAIDAGPIPTDVAEEEEDGGILPPDYRDVFNVSRSPTLASSRR